MIVNIRIRDDLYNKLKQHAKNNCRTITGELEMMLIRAYSSEEIAEAETTTPAKPVKKSIIGFDDDKEDEFSKWTM